MPCICCLNVQRTLTGGPATALSIPKSGGTERLEHYFCWVNIHRHLSWFDKKESVEYSFLSLLAFYGKQYQYQRGRENHIPKPATRRTRYDFSFTETEVTL